MDVFDPANKDWLRIDPDFAAEEVELQRPRLNSARERLGSRAGSEGERSPSGLSSFASAASSWGSSQPQEEKSPMDVSPPEETQPSNGWSGPTA